MTDNLVGFDDAIANFQRAAEKLSEEWRRLAPEMRGKVSDHYPFMRRAGEQDDLAVFTDEVKRIHDWRMSVNRIRTREAVL